MDVRRNPESRSTVNPRSPTCPGSRATRSGPCRAVTTSNGSARRRACRLRRHRPTRPEERRSGPDREPANGVSAHSSRPRPQTPRRGLTPSAELTDTVLPIESTTPPASAQSPPWLAPSAGTARRDVCDYKSVRLARRSADPGSEHEDVRAVASASGGITDCRASSVPSLQDSRARPRGTRSEPAPSPRCGIRPIPHGRTRREPE